MTITLQHYLVVSAVLFCAGAVGVVVRRNLLVMVMSIELMLAAANLALVAFSRWYGIPQGKAMALFVIAIAAAGVAVGLGLIVAAYRNNPSVAVDDFNLMKG